MSTDPLNRTPLDADPFGTDAPRRSRRAALARARVVAAVVALAAVSWSASWAGFVFARGIPGECGGDAPPCPPGTGSAAGGLLASVFLLPIGAALAGRRRPEAGPAALALASAGAAVGVFSSRFVADPMTEATTATIWATAILGGAAVLFALVALALLLWGDALAAPDDPPPPEDGG